MMYNFTDLVRRHSVPFQLVTKSGGSYASGKWESGSESVSERSGAIIPMSEYKAYQSGGTYSTKDCNLYMTTPIESPLKETQVRYKGNVYNVEQSRDFSDYSADYVYLLKWVSSFD